ncbi:MAG TPA: ATP-binding cassette domain-containing protein, partial [Candidatus Omnitrophota bacterium]|nr:ATP-binding cassette domain-containing protein [Candidatus Omnitrophota bacterium]
MILEIRDVSKAYAVEKGMLRSAAGSVRALDRVSLSVREFSTMGIVGESGSGKTTLAKIIMGLVEQSSGEVVFNPAFIRTFHKDVQIIFQNPFNSLDPKMRVVDLVGEPLVIHKLARGRRQIKERVAGLLETVELPADILSR